MIHYTIFIVDDDESLRTGLSMGLEDKYTVYAFATAEDALAAMPEKTPDLILLDISLPGMDGVDALARFQDIQPDILVIMITALSNFETAISCMKLGAYDYVVKPLNMKAIKCNVNNALETIRLRKEVQALQKRYLEENLPCFIGKSNAIHEIMEFIEMVAQSPDTPVLILGESGTGKEYIASAIHYKSPNFKGPFVSINCSAIPNNLIESELFGYEPGAFSGALSDGKQGLVEAADGGTLFLDEIGDMPMEVQAKLLRFLETGEFFKIGSVEKSFVNTRIVSATNKDLDQLILDGAFRNDLFFRLGVVSVRVPSLNERKEDILPLSKYFIEQFNRKFNKSVTTISRNAARTLLAYHWSGNVRELKNLIERGVLLTRDNQLNTKVLGFEDMKQLEVTRDGQHTVSFPSLLSSGIDIDEFHRAADAFYFSQAMELADGNETTAAKLLNLNYHTFRNRKKKLRLDVEKGQ